MAYKNLNILFEEANLDPNVNTGGAGGANTGGIN